MKELKNIQVINDKGRLKMMNKKLLMWIAAAVAVILFFSALSGAENAKIIGKWEKWDRESSGSDVMEFFKDGTGVKYNMESEETSDAETFRYNLSGSQIVLTYGAYATQLYSCEISAKNMLFDDIIYSKASGTNPSAVKCTIAIVLLFIVLWLYVQNKKENANNMPRDVDGN